MACWARAWWRLRALCLSGGHGSGYLTAAFLGVAPDFDYALNWLRISWGGWHHGFTHSIPFALLVGFVVIALFRDWKLRSYLVFTLAYASHTLLDFIFTESRGVALWCPSRTTATSSACPV